MTLSRLRGGQIWESDVKNQSYASYNSERGGGDIHGGSCCLLSGLQDCGACMHVLDVTVVCRHAEEPHCVQTWNRVKVLVLTCAWSMATHRNHVATGSGMCLPWLLVLHGFLHLMQGQQASLRCLHSCGNRAFTETAPT